MPKLIILDRDGVINREHGHIRAPEEWQPLPGSLQAIARLCRHDYKVAVITNQSGVGRGYLTVDALNKIHLHMQDLARRAGGDIEAVLFCPHHPDIDCDCRKPRPGLFHELAARLHTSLSGVPAVGDTVRDLAAATAAGADPIFVTSGRDTTADLAAATALSATPVYPDLAAFTDALLGGTATTVGTTATDSTTVTTATSTAANTTGNVDTVTATVANGVNTTAHITTAMRALAFTVGQTVSAIVWCPFSLGARLLPAATAYAVISCWAKFVAWWLRITCGLGYRVRGMENIAGPPAVLLSKHQSAWETIVYQDFLPPHTWVLKRELLFIPFFGWGLAAARPVAINRAKGTNALAQLLSKGADRLRAGLHLVVFPEGTRMPPGKNGRHNPGGAWLAAKTGADIIPIAHNAGHFWPRRSITKKPGTISVHIGPRISSVGKNPRELSEEARGWIEKEMKKLEG